MALNFSTVGLTSTGGTFIATTSGLFTGQAFTHVFAYPGTFIATSTLTNVAILVAGGGGGGDVWSNPCAPNYPGGLGGGGGGGGGLVIATGVTLSSGSYTVTVGAGGGASLLGPPSTPPTVGSPSQFSGTGIFLQGNGGGRAGQLGSAMCGGSGGGSMSHRGPANSTVTQPTQPQTITTGTYTNYGNLGGTGSPVAAPAPAGIGGNGGGAGSAGTPGGGGGQGLSSNITGSPLSYSSGGVGSAGTGFSSSYGGGGPGGGSVGTPGVKGTSGTVIVSYSSSGAGQIQIDGLTFSTSTNLGVENWIYSAVRGRWVSNTGTTSTLNVSITSISCQANTGTGAFALPLGTTAQRQTPIRSGALRYNTDIGQVEAYYTNTGWTIDIGNTQTVYTAQYLAVGGGGGGGSGGTPGDPAGTIGGYGGSGALAQGFINVSQGVAYTVTVGSGGSGSSVSQSCRRPAGAAGGSTTMTGSPFGTFFQANGGTGGTGASSSGGFSGSPGTNATAPIGGSPTAVPGGVYSSIAGTSVVYGKGYPSPGAYGVGGSPGPGNGPGPGGTGASGVVLIKYPSPQRGSGGNSVTTVGTFTLHTFTGPGTFTA